MLSEFLSPGDLQSVEAAIQKAERKTSAEIKVLVVRHCWGKLEDKAARLFHKHKLHETAERNAVLILLVMANREFFIYGDEGIHQLVTDSFWQDVRDAMQSLFRANDFSGGLCAGIQTVGEQLAEHFPFEDADVNEVSDRVDYED